MFKTFLGRHPVFKILLLHMAIVVLLAYTGIYYFKLTGSLPAAVLLVVSGMAVTAYTAHKVIHIVNDEIMTRSKSLDELSEGLKKKSDRLNEQAQDLERRESIMEQQLDVINEYGRRMGELVAVIDGNYSEANK